MRPCSHELIAAPVSLWTPLRPLVENVAPEPVRVWLRAALADGPAEAELVVLLARGLSGGAQWKASHLAALCTGCGRPARALRSWPRRPLAFRCRACLPFDYASHRHSHSAVESLARAVLRGDVEALRAHRAKVQQGSRVAARQWLEALDWAQRRMVSTERLEVPPPRGACGAAMHGHEPSSGF